MTALVYFCHLNTFDQQLYIEFCYGKVFAYYLRDEREYSIKVLSFIRDSIKCFPKLFEVEKKMVSFYTALLQYNTVVVNATVLSKVFNGAQRKEFLKLFFKQMKYSAKNIETFCKNYLC